jgi:signal transduction histidine kinase
MRCPAIPRCPDQALPAAYRLIQGALCDALKHSKGTRIQVGIESDGEQLTARVCDNGVEFDSDPSAASMSVGLGVVRPAEAAGGSA